MFIGTGSTHDWWVTCCKRDQTAVTADTKVISAEKDEPKNLQIKHLDNKIYKICKSTFIPSFSLHAKTFMTSGKVSGTITYDVVKTVPQQ